VTDKGRPSIYTDELVSQFLEYVESGLSVKQACKKENMPTESTIYEWRNDVTKDFSDKYTHAVEKRTQFLAEDMVNISDELSDTSTKEEVAVARLRIDARDKYLARMMPKKIEQKTELSGSVNLSNLSDEELDAKLHALSQE